MKPKTQEVVESEEMVEKWVLLGFEFEYLENFEIWRQSKKVKKTCADENRRGKLMLHEKSGLAFLLFIKRKECDLP